jgi:xyloglucan-specific exo-beta-1,4-glucanase
MCLFGERAYLFTSSTCPVIDVRHSVSGIDFAGASPLSLVRVGNGAGQVATSTDGGNTWTQNANGGTLAGGLVYYTANATTIVWSPSAGGVYVASAGGAFVAGGAGLPAGAALATDRHNDTVVYGSVGGKLYTSTDSGKTFTCVLVLPSVA